MTDALGRLGVEPWGSKLRRARIRAGLDLRELAEQVSRVTFTSHASIKRLETLDMLPLGQRQRFVAYVAVCVCGIHPEDFGLSDADLPAGLTLASVLDALGRIRCLFPSEARATATLALV